MPGELIRVLAKWGKVLNFYISALCVFIYAVGEKEVCECRVVFIHAADEV